MSTFDSVLIIFTLVLAGALVVLLLYILYQAHSQLDD
jgi:hypothetical protein